MTYLFLVVAGIILVAFFAFWFKKRAANQGSKSQPVPAKIVTSGQCAFEKLAENFRTQGCRYKAFKVRFAKRKEGWTIQAQQKNVNMNWQDLEQFFELEAYAKDNVLTMRRMPCGGLKHWLRLVRHGLIRFRRVDWRSLGTQKILRRRLVVDNPEILKLYL